MKDREKEHKDRGGRLYVFKPYIVESLQCRRYYSIAAFTSCKLLFLLSANVSHARLFMMDGCLIVTHTYKVFLMVKQVSACK